MNKYTIDDALASFDNFIGYVGEAPATVSEYENLKPLDNHTEVFEGKKPEWVEVLSRKMEFSLPILAAEHRTFKYRKTLQIPENSQHII